MPWNWALPLEPESAMIDCSILTPVRLWNCCMARRVELSISVFTIGASREFTTWPPRPCLPQPANLRAWPCLRFGIAYQIGIAPGFQHFIQCAARDLQFVAQEQRVLDLLW